MPTFVIAKNISTLTSPKLLMLLLAIGAPLIVHHNYMLAAVMAFVMITGFVLMKMSESRLEAGADNYTFTHTKARKNRYFGYILGLIVFPVAIAGCYLAGYLFDAVFYGLVLAVLGTMFGLTFILQSRISLHTAVAGLFIFYVAFSVTYHLGVSHYAPAVVLILYPLLALIIGWARVQLGKHNWPQVELAFAVTAVWLGVGWMWWAGWLI